MMTSSNNTYKIEPLNGVNYVAWCLEWILDNPDLWEINNGSEKEQVLADPWVATQAEEIAIAEWKKKDKKAWKEICLRISNEYLVYIDQSTTCHDTATYSIRAPLLAYIQFM